LAHGETLHGNSAAKDLLPLLDPKALALEKRSGHPAGDAEQPLDARLFK